ncbi:MAG TPA: 3-phosphoshikimate 1-carboxyvinyltransferase [Methanothermococcus okinawensis]|uniref:3-phosphoshikimate 1-carboxyvinyltransferase n=1 Tax=Methanothermococcus okinawensis TaxID=155863 RepID=A0A832ZKJ0_9EURY|nr:3-phosphoshikimate 1-carboxyvinyltransferase [Methanococcaceae archaeon]HIP84889.1 3-phosphoshikimate 1-carboxyvinyltransferase [Methanothermococcus okinawensis]HIP91136.1 3-phosphoshikimate 1-carboxyvinyltransferase [Methanothermococcus okinawensis]
MLLVERTEELRGSVNAPPSKSYTHRAVICASLGDGVSNILNPLNSEDCLSSVYGCISLGAKIHREEDRWIVEGNYNSPKTPDNVIDVRNSGTTLRILTGISSQISKGYAILTGDESIRRRPMGPLLDGLNQLGIVAFSSKMDNTAPVVVKGGKIENNLVKIRGDVSSQFITSLMMTLPFSQEDSKIVLTTPLKSAPYLDITVDVLERFGIKVSMLEEEMAFLVEGNQRYRPCDYKVEGDYSSASYILAAGVLLNSKIVVKNLFKNSKQGDRRIVDILKEMGADIKIKGDKVITEGPYHLEGISIDVKDIPDLVPTIAVLGCFAQGRTEIYNGEHVRLKECDRLHACAVELRKMGGKIREKPDGLIIEGVNKLKGARLNSYRDHRLVMAFTVAGLLAEGRTVIEGEESVKVSFPDFIPVMKSLGAKLTVK